MTTTYTIEVIEPFNGCSNTDEVVVTVNIDPGCGICEQPTNVTVSDITPNSVKLNWTPDPEAIQTQIQYKRTGVPGAPQIVVTPGSTTERVLNGLVPGATYQSRIRHNCGFGLSPFSFKPFMTTTMLMRSEMKSSSFKMWRARVQGRKTKHLKQRDNTVDRFKCSRQKGISNNKISKR